MRWSIRRCKHCTRADAKLVFLVDEVETALPDPESHGDAWLDHLLDECSDEVRVVLAGVTPGGSRPSDRSRERSRLEDLVLEPLLSEDAKELVTRPVARRFRYEARAVDRIVELAQGRPYLLQKLSLNALNRMLDEERTIVRLADVEAVADLEVFEFARARARRAGGERERIEVGAAGQHSGN